MILLAAIQPPYIPGRADLGPFIAEVWLIATIVGVLLAPFFVRRSNAVCGIVTLAGLAAALLSLVAFGVGSDVTHQQFRGLLVTDRFAMLWKVMLLLFVIGVVLLWFSSVASDMHEGDGPEFFTLLLSATLGMSLMASTTNLLMVFMTVELASLPSYVLAGFRKTDRIGAEASLKYVLFGAVTSSIMAYGLSLLYGLFGTLQIEQIGTRLAGGGPSPALLAVAIFAIIIGIGFKIAAVPFHFWCPDVFEGAGVDVAAFLSVASKGAGLALLLRILMTLAHALNFQPIQPLPAIAAVVGILGALTCTVGNTAAFVQTNIKRLLAYSSIAHAGYMLCALSLLYRVRADAPDPSLSAAQAILLYLAVYLFMNLGAFTVAAVVARQGGGEQLSEYAGLGRRAPLLAIAMAICLFSLVGLPPLGGFAAKLNIMLALGRNGSWWWWLVVVIGINTIVSLYYYARVVKVMFLMPGHAEPFEPSPLGAALSVLCAAAVVLLFIGFGPLSRLTSEYAPLYVPTVVSAAAPAGQAAPASPALSAASAIP